MFLKKSLARLVTGIVVIVAFPLLAYAQTGSPGQPLSLGDAIAMAQKTNTSLMTSSNSLQQANNSLNNTTQNYSGVVPSDPFSNPTAAKGVISLVNANNQLQEAQKAYAYQQSSLIYETEVAYFGVQDAVYGEQVAQKKLEEAQEAYKIAQVSQQVGVDTATQVSTAKSTLDQAQSGLTGAQKAIDTAYVAFDNTIGLDPTMRPDLTTEASYDADYVGGLTDIQQVVSQVLANSPTTFADQKAVDYANQMQVYTTPTQNGPLQYEAALLKQQADIQTITGTARTAFLAVGSDQDAYNAAEKSLIAAQASYNDAQANYTAGVITKDQLLQAELGLLSAQYGPSGVQPSLHKLLEDRADLALLTGQGSVTIPVSGS